MACHRTGLQSVTADPNGRVSGPFTVYKGPFMANDITGSTSQACLISVTQASPSPAEEADAPITFR